MFNCLRKAGSRQLSHVLFVVKGQPRILVVAIAIGTAMHKPAPL